MRNKNDKPKITVEKLIEHRKKKWLETGGSISADKEFIEKACEYMSENTYLYDEIFNAPDLLIELLFYVTDKDSQLVPFFLNDVQRKFINQFKYYSGEFKSGRIPKQHFIILKGRQQGFTTIIAALELAYTITRRNWQSYTLADSAQNSETIFLRKSKLFFDYLNVMFKPSQKYNSKNELYFDKMNSQWKVATAGNKDAGRSMTINFFHGSEVGMWDNAEELLGGLNRAIVPTGFAFLESTAKGQNFFKELWDRDNNYIKLFYEWWQTREYRQNFINDKHKAEFLRKILIPYKKSDDSNTEEWVCGRCYWLYKEKKLELEQVHWYYNQWKEMRSIIKQEFPCYPEEAFMSSGDTVFNNDKIAMYIDKLKTEYSKSAPIKGFFKVVYNDTEIRDKIIKCDEFVEDFNGFFRIYETPEKRIPYVIGADPAAGGDDFYAITVINNITGKRVATMHAKMSPEEYIGQLFAVGRYYNTALIAPEINIDPFTVVELKRLGYFNIFRRVKYDEKSMQKTEKLGWRTDRQNREMMITEHKIELRHNLDRFTDIPTLEEALSFVMINGKAQAAIGKHDDLLMSDMIASAARIQQTTRIIGIETGKIDGFYTASELEDLQLEQNGGTTGIYNSNGSVSTDQMDLNYILE